MDEPPKDFRYYADYSITTGYALGHAFHALGRVRPTTSVHGRRGVLSLLDQLFATLQSLDLPSATLAADPLLTVRTRLSRSARFARTGSAAVEEIASVLPRLEAEAEAELRERSASRRRLAPMTSATLLKRPRDVLGEEAYRRLPAHLRADFAEGCRAIGHRLPTAAVFHLYRVWAGLRADPVFSAVTPLPVADPGLNPTVRCTVAEALAVLTAIQRLLEPGDRPGP